MYMYMSFKRHQWCWCWVLQILLLATRFTIYIYMYIFKRTPIRAVCPLHQLLMMTMYKGLNALHAWLCRYSLSFHIHLNTADIIHDFLVWNETVFIDDSISTNAFPVNLWKPLSTLYSVEIYAQFSFLSCLAWLFFRYIY